MKKKLKKIIYKINVIVLSAVLMLPVNAINTNRTVKKAKAAGIEAGIVTLEMLLMYLLSMVAQNNGVNISFPKTKNKRTEYIKWYWQNADKLNAILDDKNYSYVEYEDGGITYKVPVTFAEIYENWEYVDLSRVVIEDNSLEIDMMVMKEATDLIAEYYDVPKLTSVRPSNNTKGNRINIKSVFQKNNIILPESAYDTMEEIGMFSYPYITVIKNYNKGVQELITMQSGGITENYIYFISSKYPFELYVWGSSVYGLNAKAIEPYEDNEMKISRIRWSVSSGKWAYEIPRYEKSGINCNIQYDSTRLIDNKGNDLYDLNENVLYTTFNVYYGNTGGTNHVSRYIGQNKQSSLSYRTFLESKYGPLIGTDDEVIIINIDNWLEYDKDLVTWEIDNIANTDEAIDRLKVIDDEASRYGDDVINTEIVLAKDYIDEVDLAKYQAVIEVQGDIQSDFNNTYTDVIPTDVDIPENILNGLMFVAFVFGEMWAHLGSYSFVLVFSATIGAIAILIGLGKQVNNRGSVSNKPSKKSKKGG